MGLISNVKKHRQQKKLDNAIAKDAIYSEIGNDVYDSVNSLYSRQNRIPTGLKYKAIGRFFVDYSALSLIFFGVYFVGFGLVLGSFELGFVGNIISYSLLTVICMVLAAGFYRFTDSFYKESATKLPRSMFALMFVIKTLPIAAYPYIFGGKKLMAFVLGIFIALLPFWFDSNNILAVGFSISQITLLFIITFTGQTKADFRV